MLKEVKRLYIVFSLFVFTFFSIPIIGYNAKEYVGYAIFLFFVILLPLLVLTSRDALAALNDSNNGSLFARFLASLPTLVFGLLSTGIGLAIVIWILYNFFIERQPEFTGVSIFAGFGIAPALIIFGLSTLKVIIGKK